MAALGAVITRGQDHREVFGLVGHPEWESRVADFNAEYGGFQEVDLYPDAVDAMNALRSAGYRVSIFANQPAEGGQGFGFLGFGPVLLALGAGGGGERPWPGFLAGALGGVGGGGGGVGL